MGKPRKARPELMDLADATGFSARVLQFLRWQETRGFSPATVTTRKRALCVALTWFKENGITHPREVTRPVLERFQRWAFSKRTNDGRPWSFRTQQTVLDGVRAFFAWMAKEDHLLFNPAADLELPRVHKTLPKNVLSLDEAERVLAQADLSAPMGVRDRAIMETLFSTALRRAELAHLQLEDVNRELGTVRVRHGKGGTERTVPIGARALAWIDRYLHESRPFLVGDKSNRWLFLGSRGERISLNVLTVATHGYIEAAGIRKTGACHLFRHSTATLMLERGADVRFIQAMLGHASLQTTQVYTQVSIRKLKEVHDATHPAERQDGATREQVARSLSDDGKHGA